MTWKHITQERAEELFVMGQDLPEPNLVKCRRCNDTDWLSANGPGIRFGKDGIPYSNPCPTCKLNRRTELDATKMLELKQKQANDEIPF